MEDLQPDDPTTSQPPTDPGPETPNPKSLDQPESKLDVSLPTSARETGIQTNPNRTPNQQDPRTLLAPDSAPEAHKTYHDELDPEPAVVAEAEASDPMLKSSGIDGYSGAWPDHGDSTSHTI